MKTLSLKTSPKPILIGGIALLALLFATTSPAPLQTYGISSATPDLTTHILTINGTFPTGTPTVRLASTPLNVTNPAPTQARIYTTLPNVAPGTYLLTVTYSGNRNYTIDVTIPGAPAGGGGDGGVPHGMQQFTTNDSWVVPSGVTRLHVEVWGAGGGGGNGECMFCGSLGGWGGAGAYSRTVMIVSEGDNITVTIGQGGGTGQSGSSSSVADTNTNYIITSGGGGGGGEPVCPNGGVNGNPGTPDPNAQIGRSSAFHRISNSLPPNGAAQELTMDPAPGTIQPLGGFGGTKGQACDALPGGSGRNGYVFIQW
jgi:hypothetical protein